MNKKIVDCIIFAMLKEERKLFLDNNPYLIYDETKKNEDFLEFTFFDKEQYLRQGVICSLDGEMGNNEAGKLFYRTAKRYQSELYINVGVCGYIDDVNIGDVIIIDELYSLCERNASDSSLQKTDAPLNKQFIKRVASLLNTEYGSIFNKNTEVKLKELRNNLNHELANRKVPKQTKTLLGKMCSHKNNIIKMGYCATYHSVVKDKNTRDLIKRTRKTNIVDMEAYYFFDWMELMKNEGNEQIPFDSKMIFFKSISDPSINEHGEKAMFERIGSRKLAMSNISNVVCYYICNLYNFTRKGESNLYKYFKDISEQHINKLIFYTPDAYYALENLCSHIILNKNINGSTITNNYISLCCDILNKNKHILVLEGTPGKGKSTFISYVYKRICDLEKPCIFISIPELSNSNESLSNIQILYLLERLLESDKNITVFVDGVEGSRSKDIKHNKSILDSLVNIFYKHNDRNFSLCIGAWHTSDTDTIKNNIVSRINNNASVCSLTFKSVSALDNNIDAFISAFGEFYRYVDENFSENMYLKNVKRIINNNQLQLRYVDFRLLYIFAKYSESLRNSSNFYEFINKYCISNSSQGIEQIVNCAYSILDNDENLCNELLTKNIYSRSFILANFVFSAFVEDDSPKIEIILKNSYILSDNINLFLTYLLKSNESDANKFIDNVLKSFNTYSDCQICSKVQLLYNISSVNLRGERKKAVQAYVIDEINKIDVNDLINKDIDIIISFRTLSIILNTKFNNDNYLRNFNNILADSENNNFIIKLNNNFHFLYYSHMEFTYHKVVDDVRFENEVIWNTVTILKNYISSNHYNSTYIETCIITLSNLLETNKKQLEALFTPEELTECKEIMVKAISRHGLSSSIINFS